MDIQLIDEELATGLLKTFGSENKDQGHIHALILAHQQFVPSAALLNALVAQYESSEPLQQIRYFGLIKKWIDLQRTSFSDPEEGLGKILHLFITKLEKSKGNEKALLLATRLKQAISGEIILTDLNDDEDADDFKPPPIIKKRKRSERPEILQYDPEEIARQITIIDHNFLSQVNRQEMIKCRWLDQEKSPTLFARSNRTNHLAYWAAYELLACKPRFRLKMLTHFLRICGVCHFNPVAKGLEAKLSGFPFLTHQYLMQLHNYQSLMGIYLGFNLSPLNICAPLWQQLSTKSLTIWKKVSRIMDYTNNYANYREELLDADTDAIIPCQEVTLKDLLYYHESSPDLLPNGQIDLQKLHAIGMRINEFRKCQHSKLHYLKYPALYDLLMSIPVDITIEVLIKIGEGEEHTANPAALNMLSPRESDSSASILELSGSEAMHTQPLSGSKTARNRSSSEGFLTRMTTTKDKDRLSAKFTKKKLSTTLISKALDSASEDST